MTDPVIYAIGDIHGHLRLFNDLLDRIADDADDRPCKIVCIGDYIDRGPQSREVLEMLIALKAQTWEHDPVFLRGNHEHEMEKIVTRPFNEYDFKKWVFWGGKTTLESYGIDVPGTAKEYHYEKHGHDRHCEGLVAKFKAAVGQEYKDFLKDLPLSFETATHFFCHAGVDFNRPLGEQKPDDLMRIRDVFLGSGKTADKIIVHGHSITKTHRPEIYPNRIAIDTGAYKSGRLTAVVLAPDSAPRFLST